MGFASYNMLTAFDTAFYAIVMVCRFYNIISFPDAQDHNDKCKYSKRPFFPQQMTTMVSKATRTDGHKPIPNKVRRTTL